MTHKYEAEKTQAYFTDNSKLYDLYESDEGPSPRDRILLEKILPRLGRSVTKILDYGCGAGGLLGQLAAKGYDVMGVEPNGQLRSLAIGKLRKLGLGDDRIKQGSVDQLTTLNSHDTDLCVSMGVFQYLSDDELRETLKRIRNVLTPNGNFVCTFQNALFDLFTFNKYTVDFYEHQLLPSLTDLGLDLQVAIAGVRKLITNPELPRYDRVRARDNIFVRLSNPLTIHKELGDHGFEVKDLYFYTLHPVPPLLREDQRDRVDRISSAIEVEKSQEWYGYFIGNAFLVHCGLRS